MKKYKKNSLVFFALVVYFVPGEPGIHLGFRKASIRNRPLQLYDSYPLAKSPFFIPTFYAPPPKLCEREAPGSACYYERLETVSEREKKWTEKP